MMAWLILELGVCTLAELGKVTGRDITTLSSAAKRLQTRTNKDLKLAESYSELHTFLLTPDLDLGTLLERCEVGGR